MPNNNEQNLLANLNKVYQDIVTNETAIVSNNSEGKNELIAYSKTELGGDAYQVVKNMSEAEALLFQEIKSSTAGNRAAVWNFIIKALS